MIHVSSYMFYFLIKLQLCLRIVFMGLEAELVADEQAPGERWALLGF